MNYKTQILAVLTIGILLPVFFGNSALATDNAGGPPQSMEEVKGIVWKAIKFFPELIIKVLKDVFSWLKNIWNRYLYPFFHGIWLKIESIFGKEVDERAPTIKEEFQKETQEIKEEAPSLFKSLWEKIKNFFKFK